MVDLQRFLKLNVSPDKMEATVQFLNKNSEEGEEDSVSLDQFMSFLTEAGIKYGLLNDKISAFLESAEKNELPVVIAKGKKPVKGEDGYLKNEIFFREKEVDLNQHFINLKEVKQITSVVKGQKIATIIPPSCGEDGCNVFGQTIPGKSGKPYILRPGKNIVQQDNEIYAAIDGQLSFADRTINVFPLYEVRGDLDLKTGNIDFIGNVVIRGNVPTGFTIKSQGDIQIYGLVEGANLHAGGSIYITGGIAALNRGEIKAGMDVHSLYINQANVEANRDIIVDNSIYHSQCKAGGDIRCKKGTIVGGVLAAGNVLQAKSIGNQMNTKTELFLGANEKIVELERSIQKQIADHDDFIQKLEAATNTLVIKLKRTGALTDSERQLVVKGKNTIEQHKQKKNALKEQLLELHEILKNIYDAHIDVADYIHPNSILHFGKYSYALNQPYKAVRIRLVENEFEFSPLS